MIQIAGMLAMIHTTARRFTVNPVEGSTSRYD